MKSIVCIVLNICLLLCISNAQDVSYWGGTWSGRYTITSGKGEKASYTMFIDFNKNSIVLKDYKDSAIYLKGNTSFTYNSTNHSLSQKFTVKATDRTECVGEMKYIFDGTNFLKCFGEFVPEQRNCLKANVVLERDIGNMWLKMLNPLSAEIVQLDATELDDFHEGNAIIRKGENFAMIDNSGKLFLAWGKFKFNQKYGFAIDKDKCGFHNGMSVVRDPVSEKYGFINSSGKLIVPCTLLDAKPCEDDGFAWGKELKENGEEVQFFLDTVGKRYIIKKGSAIEYLEKNESVYCIKNADVREFYHKTGKLLLKTKRRVIGPYSDGLIKVDTLFQLAGIKTGFIDITNRLIIPYRNGNIGNFYCGLALVTPSTGDDFRFGFLNKKGELQIKLKVSDEIQKIDQPSNFFPLKSYSKSEGCISRLEINSKFAFLYPDGQLTIDPLFEHARISDLSNVRFKALLQSDRIFLPFEANISYVEAAESLTSGFNGKRKFITAKAMRTQALGLAFYTGSIVIPPVFSQLGIQDPFSQLTKAIFHDELTNKDIEGYINMQGNFIIVKSPK